MNPPAEKDRLRREHAELLNRVAAIERQMAGDSPVSGADDNQALLSLGELKYRTLFDSASDAILLIDGGLFVDCNRAAAEILGVPREEVIGRSPAQFSPVFQINGQSSPELAEEKFALTLKGESQRFDWAVLDAENGLREVEVTLSRIGGIGSSTMFAVVRDISERARAARALRESEEMFSAAFLVSPIPMSLNNLDDEGRFLEINEAFERVSGYSRQEVVGKTPADISLWVDLEGRAQVLTELRERGAIRGAEHEFRRKSGEIGIGSIDVKTLLIRGKRCAVVSVADLTARRKAEAALSAVDAKRKRAEAELETSSEYFRAAFMTGGDARLIVNLRDATIVEVNHRFLDMYGYTYDEVVGKTSLELSMWARPEYRPDLIRQLESREQVDNFETLARRKNGETFHVLYSVNRLNIAGSDLIFGAIRDITEERRAQQAVRESEERFRGLFENATVGIYRMRPDGVIEMANPKLMQMLGCDSLLELQQRSIAEEGLLPGRGRPEVRAVLEARGTIQGLETVWTCKDGASITLRESARVVRDASGATRWYEGIVEDITDLKRSESRRLRDEERLRVLVRVLQHRATTVQKFLDQALHEAIAFTGSDIGYIYRYSEERRELILNSWSKEVMKQCAVMNPMTCYELEKTGLWGEAVRQRKPIVVNDYRSAHPLKRGYPEGHVELRRFMTVPVFKGDQIVAVIGVANKSTDYDEGDVLQLTLLMDGVWKSADVQVAEERLLEANRQLGAIAKCIPDLIWSMDLTGQLTYVSPSIERTHGWSVAEALSMNHRDFASLAQCLDNEAIVKQELERSASPEYDRNRLMTFESEQLRKDGSTYWAEISAGFIWSEAGIPVGLTGTTRDISERKRSEAEHAQLQAQLSQAQKMESIGRLAGGVAHDFNNLLTIINGYSNMALSELKPGDSLVEHLKEIQSAGERAASLTRQLLAFSRKQIMQPRALSINSVLSNMHSMLRRLMGEDVDVRLALSPEAPKVHADPHQLEQVVMNLAVNARDAMPRGGRLLISTEVSIRDQVEMPSTQGKRLCAMLAVSDSGIGMDSATRERIFEPFFTTKEAGKGTGLGLSMVQGIVAQSNGTIDVESEPAKGTTFRIYLPLLIEREREGEADSAIRSAEGNETILVVEDQAEVRKYAVMALRRRGYHVISAASAIEALAICEDHATHLDLVLTDVVMPHTSGRELVAKMAELRPGLRALYMSGYTDDVVVHHGVLNEEVQFIKKPFKPDDLAGKVRHVLSLGKRSRN